jgi:hypothetical protein
LTIIWAGRDFLERKCFGVKDEPIDNTIANIQLPSLPAPSPPRPYDEGIYEIMELQDLWTQDKSHMWA